VSDGAYLKSTSSSIYKHSVNNAAVTVAVLKLFSVICDSAVLSLDRCVNLLTDLLIYLLTS